MMSILNHQAEQEDLEGRSKYEVADIFRHYGEEYRITHLLPPIEKRKTKILLLRYSVVSSEVLL